ncbi:hypothetical protein [Paenibacillus bouchesdurhonensis]|nr:hypothetical protein [Paenibacillus bouchesdurhonensis]
MIEQKMFEITIEVLRQIQEYDSDSFEDDYFVMKEIANEALENG